MANRCTVFTHFPSVFISRGCDGAIIPIYQVFTERFPTVTLDIDNFGSCPVTLIVQHQNSPDPIIRVVPPDRQISLTVNLVTNISVQCSNTPGGTCEFFVGLDVSGCICC
ncbi:hypothetical protein SAMN04489735_101470 [Aneurinibacillus thermoaerophilus]|uniref:Uncharacterized protein n=1 Tax=Aneurinibacillus thermoaerophilus TaxID=143495 RepID=A0A1G8A8I2_ANETH|nr:hypothetical protein SAMN04489735_101470 [Aneurinibacillus thermoaerophilus]